MTIKTKKAAVEPLKSVIAITIEQIPTAYHSDKRPQGDNAPYDNCQPLSNTHRVEDLFGYKDTNNSINNLKKIINNWDISDEKSFVYIVANCIGAEPSIERQKRAKKAEEISYYLNLPQYSLRIGLHNLNAENYTGVRNRPMNHGVTLKDLRKKDTFKAKKGVKVNEYVYIYWTEQRLKNIAKAILHLLETGVWDKTIAEPDYTNPKTDINKPISGIDDKYRAFLAEHEDWHRCIVDDYTFIDKPNKSKKVSHGYIQRQAKAENKADGERFCEETEQLFSNIISLFPGWATPDPIIRYTPKQGLYYRQLRFTYDENDKFLQVIPEFLAMINADMSKFEFVFDKFSAAKAKCCKFEYDNSSATPLPGSLAEPKQKNKKTSSYKFDYDAAIISFIGTLDSPEAKRTPRYKIKSDFERFYKDLFPKEITEDITDTIDYDWVEANVFGGRTREIYDYTKGNNDDDFSKLVILTSIYYKRLCAECGVMPSAEVDDITIIPKIILDESKLVKLNYSPVSPLTLTESEKESLRNTGSYVSDDDFEYLEKVAKQIKLSIQQGDKEKKISIQDAISILGRKEFWSGIYRAAYHGTATRGNKEPYVLFALPSNLKGLSDINPKLELTDNKDIYEAKGDFYYKRYNGRVQPKKYHSYLLLLHKYMNYFKLINTTQKYYILRQVRLIDNNFYLKKNENNIVVDSATWENHFTPITNNDKRYNIFREIENAGLILSDKESKAWNKYNATMRYYGSKFQFGDFVDIVDSYYNSRTLAIISGIHETKKDIGGDRFFYDFTYVNYNNPTYHYNEYDATHGHSSLYEKYIQETTQLDKAKDFVKREIEYRKSMEELDNELQPIINAAIDEALNNTFSVGNYICYKGIEESIFQIVGFKGNNYIVIEFGDRTRTKNAIPFADKDKLQKAVSPLLVKEAMLASSKKTLSGIDLDFAITQDQYNALWLVAAHNIGLKVPEKMLMVAYNVLSKNFNYATTDIPMSAIQRMGNEVKELTSLVDLYHRVPFSRDELSRENNRLYDLLKQGKSLIPSVLLSEAKLCTLRKTAEKRTPPPSMSEIVAILDSHEFSGEPYTDADKEKLSQYQGIGGKGKEHGANVGILNQYFTPVWVCECMYKLAKHYGFNSGNILEPSAATGNMIKPFYDRGDYNHIDAFEIDKLTAKICKILYPDVEVMNQYFETAFLEYPRFTTKARQPWLKNYPYDLVIGNPPYGIHKNLYSGYFSGKDHFQQIEMFFIYKGLQMLKKGGLLIYITSINFMSTGLKTYAAAKKQIGELAEFVDAYRLPSVFDNTSICTDIIVLRKK